MDDQPNIATHTHRPEVRISRLFQFVKLHAGRRRVYLQIESGGLSYLLLVTCQTSKAVSERVGDAEFHYVSGQKY